MRRMAKRPAYNLSVSSSQAIQQHMQNLAVVLSVIDDVLSLGGRTASFNRDTPLLGAIPELDSMAVANLITRLEDCFGIAVDDGDLDGDTFATVGDLTDFVNGKLAD